MDQLNTKANERPAVDPKLLAPKPGAKPTQPRGRRPAAAPPSPSPVSIEKPKAGSGATAAPIRKPAPAKRPANTRPKRKKR